MTVLDRAPSAPAVAIRPPWDRRRGALAGVVLVAVVTTVWSVRQIEVSITDLLDGWEDVRNLLDRMLPPQVYETPHVVELIIETFWMAFLGTLLAVALSLPIGFLAARNTTPHRFVYAAARGVITGARAIPDLVFALVFVRALGLGVLPGVLALALHSIGMLGKLFADAIEEVDEGPREAIASTGASRLQGMVTAVLPQVIPSILGVSLYRLDINVRTSTILGYVGAGGIGQELRATLGNLRYSEALWIVLLIFALILVVELVSVTVRATLLGADDRTGRTSLFDFLFRHRATAAEVVRTDRPTTPPWTAERRWRAVYTGLFVVVLAVAVRATGVSPIALVTSLDDMWRVGQRFFPPDFTTLRQPIIDGMLETIAIAVCATVIAVVLAVPLALLAARNTAPTRWLYGLGRYGIVAMRGVPELVLAVIFVVALGLGPFPGVLALGLGGAGFLAKLLADAIEEVKQGPRDAVASVGASGVQQTATGVVPQVVPAFVGHSLYMLDINIRSSAVLGIVGAGGIGFLLVQSIRTLHFDVTAAILISLFVVVYAIERLSGWIRKLLI